MLSYQHEYHAGNLADVLKHTCLCLILDSLCKKEKPFTIIDSHSGAGIFSLDDERILKTNEANYSYYLQAQDEIPAAEFIISQDEFIEYISIVCNIHGLFVKSFS